MTQKKNKEIRFSVQMVKLHSLDLFRGCISFPAYVPVTHTVRSSQQPLSLMWGGDSTSCTHRNYWNCFHFVQTVPVSLGYLGTITLRKIYTKPVRARTSTWPLSYIPHGICFCGTEQRIQASGAFVQNLPICQFLLLALLPSVRDAPMAIERVMRYKLRPGEAPKHS